MSTKGVLARAALAAALAFAMLIAACVGEDAPPVTNTQANDGATPLDASGTDPSEAGPSDAAGDVATTPDAADAGPGCGSRVACVRTVFVTKATFNGDLGSVEGADAKCQAAADETDHPMVADRKFIAWLSGVPKSGGGVSVPAARIAVQGKAPYQLPTGTIVAADWASFASNQHQSPINVDQFGVAAAVLSSHAWTGTSPTGSSLGGQCGTWNMATANLMGRQGSVTASDAMWSDEQERPCISEARLYCIEK